MNNAVSVLFEKTTMPNKDWLESNQSIFAKHPKEIVANAVSTQEFCKSSSVKGGVYFLLVNNRIVYVGMSETSVKTRIECHTKRLRFDAVSVIPLPWNKDYILMVESLYIGWLRPWFNGRLQAVPAFLSELPLSMANTNGPTEDFIYQGGDVEVDNRRTVSRTVSRKVHMFNEDAGNIAIQQSKVAASFRLGDDCLEMLRILAEEKGISQAAVIELAVRDANKKHERANK